MILVKTETGQQVLRDRSVPLTPRQRAAFILFDGQRSIDDVLAACAGTAREDVEQMIGLGLLARPGGVATPGAPEPAPPAAVPERTPRQRYMDAYGVAIRLTAALGLRGVRLNMALETAASYEELLALAPRIRAAVGPAAAAELDQALGV